MLNQSPRMADPLTDAPSLRAPLSDVCLFDKSHPAPGGVSSSPGPASAGAALPSVHRLETTVRSLPRQSRAQRYFHVGNERIREQVFCALSNSDDDQLMKRAGKMALCCMSPSFYLRANDVVSVSVIRCRDRLCPTCSRARSAQTRERAKGAVARMDSIRFMTLTMPHTDDDLTDQLKILRSAFTRLRKSGVWRDNVTGGLATIEITHNARENQWHPHLHALLDGSFVPHAELREAWRNALNHAVGREWISPGERVIVDIRATGGRSAAVQYITKYVTKPADVASWKPELIVEVADALAGARTLSTFGNLHNVTLDKADPNAEEPDSILICGMYDVQMRRTHRCKLAEAFVVLLCHVCEPAAQMFTPLPHLACDVPDQVLDAASYWLCRLGKMFVEHSPMETLDPPW